MAGTRQVTGDESVAGLIDEPDLPVDRVVIEDRLVGQAPIAGQQRMHSGLVRRLDLSSDRLESVADLVEIGFQSFFVVTHLLFRLTAIHCW